MVSGCSSPRDPGILHSKSRPCLSSHISLLLNVPLDLSTKRLQLTSQDCLLITIFDSAPDFHIIPQRICHRSLVACVAYVGGTPHGSCSDLFGHVPVSCKFPEGRDPVLNLLWFLSAWHAGGYPEKEVNRKCWDGWVFWKWNYISVEMLNHCRDRTLKCVLELIRSNRWGGLCVNIAVPLGVVKTLVKGPPRRPVRSFGCFWTNPQFLQAHRPDLTKSFLLLVF